MCHEEIEELCGELIEDGILGCLEKQLSKLKGRCLDAYVTTRHHIDAAKDATSRRALALIVTFQVSRHREHANFGC